VTTTISRQASHSLKLSLGFSTARAQASADISLRAALEFGPPTSGLGTKRTSVDVRYLVANGGKADVAQTPIR
jgi:hypothetical protein